MRLAVQEAAGREILEVLVDGGGGGEVEVIADLLDRRGKAAAFDRAGDEIEDLFLSRSWIHGPEV